MGQDLLSVFLKRKIEEGNNYSAVCTESCCIRTVQSLWLWFSQKQSQALLLNALSLFWGKVIFLDD